MLIRFRRRRRPLARCVANKAVELVGHFLEIGCNMGEAFVRTLTVLGALRFQKNQALAVDFQKFGLALLQFGNDFSADNRYYVYFN